MARDAVDQSASRPLLTLGRVNLLRVRRQRDRGRGPQDDRRHHVPAEGDEIVVGEIEASSARSLFGIRFGF